MKSQKELILGKNWDYLIVLDACRYDYFKEVCEDYLSGTLKKVRSAGTDTVSWFKKNFKDRHDDIVYVSANPSINSKVKIGNLDARNKFYKVIDVWDWGWDEEIGTVHPQEVNEAVKKTRFSFPNKRFIIHYVQPHSPYIGLDVEWDKDQWAPVLLLKSYLSEGFSFGKFWKVIKSSADWLLMREVLGKFDRSLKICWKIRRWLGLKPVRFHEAAIREYEDLEISAAYEANLKSALKHAKKLIDNLPGKKVITSDHGELLGENGYYGHPRWVHDSSLAEVPWFEVSNE